MIGSTLRVLTYHRVLPLPGRRDSDPSLNSATPVEFDRQMSHLAKHYRPVSAGDVLEALATQRDLPDRAVIVTFDDAYRDFADVAWPIMRRYRVPATLFVPTAFPDQPERGFWWDQLYCTLARATVAALHVPALGSLSLRTVEERRESTRTVQRYMKSIPHSEVAPAADRIHRQLGAGPLLPPDVLGWDELRALARDGVTLAAHTRTHPALDQLPIEEARAEIEGSREDMRREIGSTLPIFAYPFGAHSDAVVDAVKQAGFQAALTCRPGFNPLPLEEPLRLRRTNITTRTTQPVFRLRLRRVVSYVDQWRLRAR
jgi:peptidoglycan/xylan/chitin deacetylase (PgdA/CDA1 family)